MKTIETTDGLNPGELYAGYSQDESLSPYVSSGGIVSILISQLLEDGEIDGAIVSKIISDDGEIRGETSLIHLKNELVEFAGSSYIETPVLEKVKELSNIPGRFAIVALPCQIRAIQSHIKSNPELKAKFFPLIGLFCRGNVVSDFYHNLSGKFGIDSAKVKSIRVRRKYIKGEVLFEMEKGELVTLPFFKMNAYRVLGINALKTCAWCTDHMAENADISVGDIFVQEYMKKEKKHSAFIVRDENVIHCLETMKAEQKIYYEYFGLQKYYQKFSKIERFDKDLESRKIAAKLLGIRPPSKNSSGKKSPFRIAAWMMYFLFDKSSRSRRGKDILFNLPVSIIQSFAFLFKGLSRL